MPWERGRQEPQRASSRGQSWIGTASADADPYDFDIGETSPDARPSRQRMPWAPPEESPTSPKPRPGLARRTGGDADAVMSKASAYLEKYSSRGPSSSTASSVRRSRAAADGDLDDFLNENDSEEELPVQSRRRGRDLQQREGRGEAGGPPPARTTSNPSWTSLGDAGFGASDGSDGAVGARDDGASIDSDAFGDGSARAGGSPSEISWRGPGGPSSPAAHEMSESLNLDDASEETPARSTPLNTARSIATRRPDLSPTHRDFSPAPSTFGSRAHPGAGADASPGASGARGYQSLEETVASLVDDSIAEDSRALRRGATDQSLSADNYASDFDDETVENEDDERRSSASEAGEGSLSETTDRRVPQRAAAAPGRPSAGNDIFAELQRLRAQTAAVAAAAARPAASGAAAAEEEEEQRSEDGGRESDAKEEGAEGEDEEEEGADDSEGIEAEEEDASSADALLSSLDVSSSASDLAAEAEGVRALQRLVVEQRRASDKLRRRVAQRRALLAKRAALSRALEELRAEDARLLAALDAEASGRAPPRPPPPAARATRVEAAPFPPRGAEERRMRLADGVPVEVRDAFTQCVGNHAGVQADLGTLSGMRGTAVCLRDPDTRPYGRGDAWGQSRRRALRDLHVEGRKERPRRRRARPPQIVVLGGYGGYGAADAAALRQLQALLAGGAEAPGREVQGAKKEEKEEEEEEEEEEKKKKRTTTTTTTRTKSSRRTAPRARSGARRGGRRRRPSKARRRRGPRRTRRRRRRSRRRRAPSARSCR